MTEEEFKKVIKNERKAFMSTFNVIHKVFIQLGLDNKDPEYFINNASKIVEDIRSRVWKTFLELEEEFSNYLYKQLIPDNVDEKLPRKAVEDYIDENTNNFYTLSLSNTQSRRSRAGKEFEAIISHLFIGANIPFDEQGLIGTGVFKDKNLAKLVDHVIPGAIEYGISKRNVVALTAKTTLRERWQEIGDELDRTRMSEIYLATVDEEIGENTLDQLRANNIYPVTTATLKEKYYKDNNLVLTFEDFLQLAKDVSNTWTKDKYSDDEIKFKITNLKKAMNNTSEEYIIEYLQKRIIELENF